MKDTLQLYKELGNLFYAIAAADNNISSEEKKKLDDEIQYAWKHYEDSKDEYGSDNSFLIQFEFETMEDQYQSSEDAFKSFEYFFKENHNDINKATRHRIYNSAKHIAESVRKINFPELEYLNKLKELMKN